MDLHRWIMIAIAGLAAFATVALLGWIGLFTVAVGLVSFTVAALMARR